jgi:hypothetical protein
MRAAAEAQRSTTPGQRDAWAQTGKGIVMRRLFKLDSLIALFALLFLAGVLAAVALAQERDYLGREKRAPFCDETGGRAPCRDREAYEANGEAKSTVAEQPTYASNQCENKSPQAKSSFAWGWLFLLIPLFWWKRTRRY